MSVTIFLRKLLRVPNPVEMGRSKHTALQSRIFGAKEGAYTWEDWHEEVARLYPIRAFISEKIGREIGVLQARARDKVYWLKCHVLPEYRGYSRIDLRNPGPGIDYKYGWVDRSEAVLYACFVCLRQYIENEEPVDPALFATPEEFEEDPGLRHQKEMFDEAQALYQWWMKGRIEEEAEEDRLWEAYHAVRKDRRGSDPEKVEAAEMAGKVWTEYRQWRTDRENVMLHRLISIRQSFWT
jgi:hypothetical protein